MLCKSFPTGRRLRADQPNALEGAFDLGGIQLHVGALGYHTDFLGHQPEALKAYATFRAAL